MNTIGWRQTASYTAARRKEEQLENSPWKLRGPTHGRRAPRASSNSFPTAGRQATHARTTRPVRTRTTSKSVQENTLPKTRQGEAAKERGITPKPKPHPDATMAPLAAKARSTTSKRGGGRRLPRHPLQVQAQTSAQEKDGTRGATNRGGTPRYQRQKKRTGKARN